MKKLKCILIGISFLSSLLQGHAIPMSAGKEETKVASTVSANREKDTYSCKIPFFWPW